jgi:hypothetical protein
MLFVIGFAMAPAVAQPNCFYEKANAGTHGPSEDHPDIATPGSLLVYPFWTAEQGGITLITVTNTNCGHVRCYPSYNESRYGDVMLHFQYVDGETCLLIDRWEVLSPNDTFSVLAGEHGLSDGFGWLYVTSWDPEFFVPIDFDWLVGNLIVGSGEENFLWQCQAIPFQSFGDCYPGYAPCRGPYPM